MAARRIIVPLLALGIAGATALYARSWMESQRADPTVQAAPAAVVDYTEILVARDEMPSGSFVQPGALRWQTWPNDDVPDSYYVKGERSEDDLLGAVVRRAVTAGQPLTDGYVVMPGDRGFLAAVLDPDMRAVSVPVNDASSNAGLIFPGDRVDLILTQTLPADDDGAIERIVSETVLTNVRVIAMGRRVRDDAEEELVANKVKTATLEVTPGAAEKVALVTELGKLSLSLRSLATVDAKATATPDERRFTWDSDVARVLRPENQPTSTLLVMRGAESEKVGVRTGAPK